MQELVVQARVASKNAGLMRPAFFGVRMSCREYSQCMTRRECSELVRNETSGRFEPGRVQGLERQIS